MIGICFSGARAVTPSAGPQIRQRPARRPRLGGTRARLASLGSGWSIRRPGGGSQGGIVGGKRWTPGPTTGQRCPLDRVSPEGDRDVFRSDRPWQHRRRRGRGAVGWGGPLRPAQGRAQSEVRQDLRDALGLLAEREHPHGSATAWADQRIRLRDLRDEASTSSAERRAQARFAAATETSRPSSMRGESSPCTFRRFPRFPVLYQPYSAAERSRFTFARAASFAGKALALTGRLARARPSPRGPPERGGPPPLLGLSPGLCGPGGNVAYLPHRTGPDCR